MDFQREKMLKELMTLDFSIIEMNLYLDTHPYDARAISIYNNYVQNALVLRSRYERMYGPLTVNFSTSTCPWQWIQSPWPWEIDC